MCNLYYIEIIRWRNNQYWEQRKYLKKLQDHLTNIETHLNNTVALHSDIDYYTNTSEIHENYLVYLEQKIEETKRRIKSNKYILRSYKLLAKINTSIG